MSTKITTPELFNLSSNNTAATQLPVFTTSTRPTPTTSTVQVEYLVVAGGGGGGNFDGGGGGAGGYLTNYNGTPISITTSNLYTVTVGEGGVGGQKNVITSGVGGNSVFDTIISYGGGGGASDNNTGPSSDGGSGGGAAGGSNPTIGLASPPGQGYNGGNSSGNLGGGGGGASEAGNTDGQGHGGDGLSNSITGTPTFYAGGGGGDSRTGGYPGGDGGGGAGSGSLPSNDGTPNTGGGGGAIGGTTSYQGGSGGSGIVILRYPTSSSLNITTTGSLVYTESTDGSDTVLQFTEGSGNFGFAANNIAVGEMIFNSTTGKVEYWDGFQWNMIKDEAVDYTSNLLTWIDVGPGKSWSGSGSLMTDLSGNGNNFTLTGQSYTAGNNYVTLPNSSAYATSNISMTYNVPKTLLMWHKISINSGYSTAFGTNSASYYSYILYGNATGTLPDESVSTYTNYNVTNYVSGLIRNGHYAYTDNTWRMMALVEDTTNWPNNMLLFYMNGSLAGQSSTGKYWSVDKLAIGRLGSTASGSFFGDVGQWRVYSESLTADKILAIYNATKAAYGL